MKDNTHKSYGKIIREDGFFDTYVFLSEDNHRYQITNPDSTLNNRLNHRILVYFIVLNDFFSIEMIGTPIEIQKIEDKI
ncbi:hypothetical protein KKF91_14710 [Myxococcota bacterium]|nr:hypothetical protein [Myxococcota bacterium]MBU1896672.1 hypothetical protein [Myxococcota bacterium]